MQKGTIGVTLRSEDMPFTKDGIQPDIIINPHCIPSRMTIGQLFECVLAKASALQGKIADATPFNKLEIDDVKEMLKSYGYDENGNETLYCGMTGKEIRVKIFIGPTYYLRLKHMVADKIHCLTLDHKVYTYTGWKTFDKLTKEDILATFNLVTNMVEYQKPLGLIKYDSYNGPMYEIDKEVSEHTNVNIKVTHDHRMLVSKDGRRYELVKIQDIQYPIFFKLNYQDILINESDVYITQAVNTPVFCVTVFNETFLCQRNGNPIWTGNSRARGTTQLLTRQPPEGRALNGGLRFGEMERDAMIAHGLSQFLKERLVDTSDIYNMHVCNICGIIASKVYNKKSYICNSCKGSETSKVTVPYAFKLLVQELMAINILPKIMPEINEYTVQS